MKKKFAVDDKNMNKSLIHWVGAGLLVLFLLAAAVYFFFEPQKSAVAGAVNPADGVSKPAATVEFSGASVRAFVAGNEETRSRGLSGVKSLKPDEGMIFLFDDYSPRNFWMKDMNFPLDFIFINDDKVMDIAEKIPNAPPDTPDRDVPRVITTKKVNIVLEVNSGFIEKHRIKIGDRVTVKMGSR